MYGCLDGNFSSTRLLRKALILKPPSVFCPFICGESFTLIEVGKLFDVKIGLTSENENALANRN